MDSSGFTAVPAPVAALDRAARRRETPCGDGAMVWREWGDGAPVVLLHGGYGSWQHWLRNIEPLTAAGYRVVAPDLPGLGESALPPPTDNLDDVSDILADGLARILAPGERFHLIGFSFGGHMSGRIAARLGDRARSLILVGAGGFGLPRGRRTELTKAPPNLTPAETFALQRDNLGRLMFEHRVNIDDIAVWMQVRHVALGRFKSVKFASGTWLARSLPLVTARLGGIWGELDITAHPYVDQRDAFLKSLQPDALFHVVYGMGHWVQYEAADEFNRVLLDWLARIG